MKNKKQAITDGEVQQALKKFMQQGGLIKKLPDEIVPQHTLVGAKFSVYETIQESGGAVAVE